jgi:opacity protein-like surface antigen
MKRLAFAAVLSVCAASSALAADFPPYAAPPRGPHLITSRPRSFRPTVGVDSMSAAISVLVGVALAPFPIQRAARFPAPQAVRSSEAANSVLITSSIAAS